VTYIYIYIFTI